jgi:hypothetical protein
MQNYNQHGKENNKEQLRQYEEFTSFIRSDDLNGTTRALINVYTWEINQQNTYSCRTIADITMWIIAVIQCYKLFTSNVSEVLILP